jgi:hypothetical protein
MYVYSCSAQVAINTPVALILDDEKASSSASQPTSDPPVQLIVPDFITERPGYATFYDNNGERLTFEVGASFLRMYVLI